MKLIELHVDNFGVLHDYDLQFDNEITCIFSKNGSGKSTLAAFIRVMLFGFDNANKRSVIDNERKKYQPWQGGNYGGYLIIEVSNHKYMISRSFKEKEKNDDLKVIDMDSNSEVNIFGDRIGETILSVDSATFKKTACIVQSNIVVGSNQDIMPQLSETYDNMDSNYSEAVLSINDALNKYSTTRRTGELYKEYQELNDIRNVSRNANLAKERMHVVSDEINQINNVIDGYGKKGFSDTLSNLFVVFIVLVAFIISKEFFKLSIFSLLLVMIISAGIAFALAKLLFFRKQVDEELLEQYNLLSDKKAEYNVIRKEFEELEQYINDYDIYKKRYDERVHKYELLQKTKKLLEQAYLSYIKSFQTPLKKKFDYYEDAIGVNKDCIINPDGEVLFIEASIPRKADFLSMGEHDKTSFSLRMSFIDSVYSEEKPFLILDDPFINFDDESLDKAFDLLDELKNKYQIIYFTCNTNRRID